jgi:hypothetical protein
LGVQPDIARLGGGEEEGRGRQSGALDFWKSCEVMGTLYLSPREHL